MQMKNLRFARQQIVTNTQALHRVENLLDIARGHIVSQIRDGIISCFDRMQDFDPELQPFGVWFALSAASAIEQTDPRVKSPALLIKRPIGADCTVESLDV